MRIYLIFFSYICLVKIGTDASRATSLVDEGEGTDSLSASAMQHGSTVVTDERDYTIDSSSSRQSLLKLQDLYCGDKRQSSLEVLSHDTILNPISETHDFRARHIFEKVFGLPEMSAVGRRLSSNDGRYLSFGANDGTEVLELLKRYPNSQAWGYDINRELVQKNQKRLIEKGVHEFTSDIDALPQNGFDFIACNFVMFCNMSFSQFEGYIKTFASLLKPDGMLELLVYPRGGHRRSFFDPQVIEEHIAKHPELPSVYLEIPHPDVAKEWAKAKMLLFLLAPNSISPVKLETTLIKLESKVSRHRPVREAYSVSLSEERTAQISSMVHDFVKMH